VTTVFSVQVDRALTAAETMFPPQVAQMRGVLAALGLSGLQGLTTIARVDGAGFSATTSVNVVGERRGLARLFEGGEPATLSGLAFVPDDAIWAMSGRIDVASIFDVVTEAAATMDANDATQMQARFERRFGLRLRQDVLAHLGGETTLAVAPTRGLIPDVGIVFRCSDAAKLEKALVGIIRSLPFPDGTGLASFEHGGRTVYTVPLLRYDLGSVPLAPTFGIIDGHLVVAPFPTSYRRFADVKSGARPGLVAKPEFQRLRERVPRDALEVSYLDLPRVYELLYDTGLPLLQAIPQPDGSCPFVDMPTADVAVKHLFGRIAWRTADASGMHWHSHSAIDTSGMLIGALAGGAAAGLFMSARIDTDDGDVPAPKGPRGQLIEEERRCQGNVALLRARMAIHERDRGSLPAALDELRTKTAAADTFLVPGTDKPYVYLGPAGKGRILLHGYPNGADDQVTALTLKREIVRVTSEELTRLLGE
jgi:hypothetical protein